MPFGFIGALVAGAGIDAAVAAVTLTGVLEVTAAAGAVLGVIGKVTKSPILTDIGLGLAVIGGVGSLASAAGLFGAAGSASLFGAAPAAAATDATDAATTSAFGAASSDASGSAASYGATSAFDTGNAAGVGAGTAAENAAAPSLAGVDQSPALNMADNSGLTDQTSAVVGSQPDASTIGQTQGATGSNLLQQTGAADATAPTTASGSVPMPTGPGTGAAASDASAGGGATSGTAASPYGQTSPFATGNASGATAGYDPAPTAGTGGDGVIQKLLDFANNNKVVTLGVLQAGGSLLSGLTSTLTPAQVAALNAQANANNSAAALATQQQTNLAMPKAVASSAPVTGSPATLVPGATAATPPPPGLGLLNTTSAPSAPVTGANA